MGQGSEKIWYISKMDRREIKAKMRPKARIIIIFFDQVLMIPSAGYSTEYVIYALDLM